MITISTFIFLMGVTLFMTQFIFVLISRKKELESTSLTIAESNWSTKLIQVFIGLQGYTIFALPWFAFNDGIDLRFIDVTNPEFDNDFVIQNLMYSELLFVCFTLLITSSLIQIAFKIKKKSTSTYIYEIFVSLSSIVIGLLLMQNIESGFVENNWFSPVSMLSKAPDLTLKPRYGIYLALSIGAVNALVQSLLFFRSPAKPEVVEESELLDDLS